MAGVKVKIDARRFKLRADQIESGLKDATPLMRTWSEIAHSSVTRNFEVGGRPAWKPLHPITIRRKGHDRILIGRTGNLSRVAVKVSPRSFEIGTTPPSKSYAATHQFGRGNIPQRRFLLLQDEDISDMKIEARTYLKRIASA